MHQTYFISFYHLTFPCWEEFLQLFNGCIPNNDVTTLKGFYDKANEDKKIRKSCNGNNRKVVSANIHKIIYVNYLLLAFYYRHPLSLTECLQREEVTNSMFWLFEWQYSYQVYKFILQFVGWYYSQRNNISIWFLTCRFLHRTLPWARL